MTEDSRAAVRAVETLERKDRVLIVEDEDNARKGYEQLLQRWGYDVLGVAGRGQRAKGLRATVATLGLRRSGSCHCRGSPGQICNLPAGHADRRRGTTGHERPGPAEAIGSGSSRRASHHHHRKGERRTRRRGHRVRSVLVHREAAERPGVARAAGPRARQSTGYAATGGVATATTRVRTLGRTGRCIEAHARSDAHRRDRGAQFGIGADYR